MAMSAMFSVLEVVPLTLLTLDAWDFVRTTRGDCDVCGKSVAVPHKWTFYFLMAVGFWNFLGAGVFGFLINLPIISYYEVGTILTPNHGHAAMMGVFGMLAIALMVFVLRQTTDDARWPGIEKYIKVGFWGTNIGLLMMVALQPVPRWRAAGMGRGAARLLACPQPGLHRHRHRAPDRMAAPAGRPGLHHLRCRAAVDRGDQGVHRRAGDAARQRVAARTTGFSLLHIGIRIAAEGVLQGNRPGRRARSVRPRSLIPVPNSNGTESPCPGEQ